MSDITDVVALVPMDAGDAEPATTALLEVYAGLAGDVVTYCETERKAIVRDTVEHLKNVRDALAPSGRFKAWCEAAGFTYGTVKNTLTRIYGKQADNELLPARSLSQVKAEAAAALARAEKVEGDYRHVNNELAVAHTLIKRLKGKLSPLQQQDMEEDERREARRRKADEELRRATQETRRRYTAPTEAERKADEERLRKALERRLKVERREREEARARMREQRPDTFKRHLVLPSLSNPSQR